MKYPEHQNISSLHMLTGIQLGVLRAFLENEMFGIVEDISQNSHQSQDIKLSHDFEKLSSPTELDYKTLFCVKKLLEVHEELKDRLRLEELEVLSEDLMQLLILVGAVSPDFKAHDLLSNITIVNCFDDDNHVQ
jgi:hypothetical protein